MLIKNKQKDICQQINTLFERDNFFENLCLKSNNNLDLVINNLERIINYYLSTYDSNINYPLDELLQKANSVTKNQTEFLLCPNNMYFIKELLLTGINAQIPYERQSALHLDLLDNAVSAYPLLPIPNITSIYQNIKEAIISSFFSPEILYKSILKQPKGKELPIAYGTEEKIYYRSILDIRLKNIEESLKQTSSKIVKKTINKILGNEPVLIIFPRYSKKYYITDQEILDKETSKYIHPFFLSYIKLPSKYKLITLCAKNKNTPPGELLNINTGEHYTLSESELLDLPFLTYSRYERVSITDDFVYSNQEFTGDINYDIDIIYGQLDSNKSRSKLKQSPIDNINFIKRRDDIMVRKRADGKYEIRNGRHRILYLKHYYETNYKDYSDAKALDKLKERVTIPMYVESSLKDPIANYYLYKLFEHNNDVIFQKVDITNDNPDIIVIINKHVYHISNLEELINLYTHLINNNYNNTYRIGINDKHNKRDNNLLFDYLIITLKEQIYNMNYLDIINYLLSNKLIIDSKEFEIKNLNYFIIYQRYLELCRTLQRNIIFGENTDIVRKTANKFKLEKVGKRITEILSSNEELLLLSWNELYNKLKEYPDLSDYSSSFLEEAANYEGYQTLKIEYFYNNMRYTKKHKL